MGFSSGVNQRVSITKVKYYISYGAGKGRCTLLARETGAAAAAKETVIMRGTYAACHDKMRELEVALLAKQAAKGRRHVYPSAEIPHLWAHELQDEARNSNGTFYFNGLTIYSYGSHFPIAIIAKHKGKRAVLFNSKQASSTTSGHQSATRSAIPPDVPIFEVPLSTGGINGYACDYPLDHKRNLAFYSDEITRVMAEVARARTAHSREWRVNNTIPKLYKAAKDYAKFFGLKPPKLPKLPDDWQAYGAELRSLAAKQIAAKKKADAAALVKRLEDNKERIEQWKRGEIDGSYYGTDLPTFIRVKGDQVETTRGVRVPVDHARRALAFIKQVKASGKEYKRNGRTLHIGNYPIDRITVGGTLHAGCHVIEWSEIERIAPQLEAV